MTKHEKALKFLEDNIGQHEVPMGSNTGPFVQSCQAATWLAGSRWPWCVATWVKAWTVAGYKLPYRGAGAYAMLDWYRQHAPAWIVPLAKAKPGAAVIVNIGSGHLATLEQPFKAGDTVVHTIDGNWGDAVARTTHPISAIRGVIDPPENAPPLPPAKPKVFEVVTSASGHSKLVYASGAKAVGRKLPELLNAFGGVTIRRRKN